MRPYAVTLPYNTVRIIFAAGLKGDKFKRYIEILSALIVLLNKYVKFELGLKNQIGADKARYIKFNSAFFASLWRPKRIKLDILNLIPQALKRDLDLNHVKG